MPTSNRLALEKSAIAGGQRSDIFVGWAWVELVGVLVTVRPGPCMKGKQRAGWSTNKYNSRNETSPDMGYGRAHGPRIERSR